MIDREAVRSNAKYLRNVRPIDPEEISEYVEGQPHPGVVRETLREEAYNLALREREDGAFVPVSDDPVSPPGWRPEAFPESYAFALEDLLVERYGANWHRGDSGDRLRRTIRRLKADYYHGNDVTYDDDAALGYAIYHLPDFYAAAGYVLDSLTATRRLPRRLRVLDVGAGAGGPALGLHDYLPDDAVVDYRALEPSAAASVLDRLLSETRRNFRPTIVRERAEAFDPETGAYDLLLFGNVLSELDDPAATVERYLDALAPDGAAVALAPADLETSTGLRSVERAVAPPDADVSVYAPALRLWPGEAPTDRGWSFDERPALDVPAFQRRLAEAAGDDGRDRDPEGESGSEIEGDDRPDAYRNTSVRFSYSILRPDGARRFDLYADPDRHAKMAAMDDHVTERIDLLAVKLSRDLGTGEGHNPVFKVGDGSERLEQYAVVTRESSLNRELGEAPYGAVISFENALALWNDDEGAYNLVVDAETVADVVAA